MKTILQKCFPAFFLMCIMLVPMNSWGQTIIFTETIGTCCSSTTTTIASTTFDNSGLTYSGDADTRTSTASTSYTGSSGSRNVFITNTIGRFFMISGINTIGFTDLMLSFGHQKSTIAGNNELVVEVSEDGSNWSQLTYSRPTGTGTTNWLLITPTGIIPATANLSIRFRQTSISPQFRIDDIKLVGTPTTTQTTWNGTTWSNGAPTSTVDAIIDGDLTTSTDVICKDLTVNSGRTLTISGANKLSVTGNLINNGQAIFKSDATGTGMFDEFIGTITGSGTVQVERYIPACRAFRFLTSAVTTSGSIRANWQNDGVNTAGLGTHITGSGGASNGFDVTASNSPSMFTFTNGAWAPVTSTLGVLTAGTPYRLMVRGDRTISLATNTPTPTPTTLRATGALYKGNFTPALNQTALGYSLVGNPYQAPMDIKVALAGSTNLDKLVLYYWDPNLNDRGAYVTRTLSGTPGTNNVTSNFTEILQPGQAVFVKKDNTASAATMTIAETHKRVDQGSAEVFRTNNTLSNVGMIRVNLQANLQNTWQTIEGTLAIFNDDYSWAVTQEDATKMGNLDEEVSFMLDGTALAIAFQNDASNTSTLPIQINKMRHADYQWTFDLDNYNGLTPMLWDEQNQTMTAITNNTVVPFSTTATATDRFKIVFQETMNVDDFSLHVALYPNPGKSNQSFYLSGVTDAKVSIQSLLGQEIPVTTQQNGQTMEVKPETVLSTGVYFVSITQAGKTAQVKWIVE